MVKPGQVLTTAVILWLAFPSVVPAPVYLFADATAGTDPMGRNITSFSVPALNNSGVVAFRANLAGGGSGKAIYYSGPSDAYGGPLVMIADTSATQVPTSDGTPARFHQLGNPSISNTNLVAFRAIFKDANNHNSFGVYGGDGNTLVTIVEGPNVQIKGIDQTSINRAGTRVAFSGRPASTAGQSLFVASSDGSTPPVMLVTSEGPFASFDDPFLNDGLQLAFRATLDAGGSGIFRTDALTATTIVIANSGGDFTRFGPDVSMNSSGIVAFAGELTTGATGVFTGNGGPFTTIADDSGLFASFGAVSITSSNLVAFLAVEDGGREGIFTSLGEKIIAVGDPLLGQIVTDLDFGREGLNDAGQVAFFARLSNGASEIFVASPEPAQ